MPGQILQAEWYSEALGRPTQVCALFPDLLPREGKLRTVYLLPGALSSADGLFTETDLASYFEGRALENTAIFCVTPTFSFYTDYQKEYRFAHQYFTYITKELVEMTRTLFPLSCRREDTAIYGCSMGGWGAYYCGLNNPETYGFVGAQSGMLDMEWAVANRPFMTIKHQRQFGDDLTIRDTQYDLYALTAQMDARIAAGEKCLPKLFQSWGEEDYLAIPNEHMNAHMKQLKHLDYTFHLIPGPHGWGIHGQGLHLFLDWFAKGGEG